MNGELDRSGEAPISKQRHDHDPLEEYVRYETRRQFFSRGANAVGWAALAALAGRRAAWLAAGRSRGRRSSRPIGQPAWPHFAAKAKHVIYLHMVGGPSQMDLFDYKPKMDDWYDKDLPDSIRMGQRLTTMTSGQTRFPIAPSKYKFAQHGKCGMWVSELLPHTAKMVDDMCFIRSMHTEAINHEPAITYMQTGNQITGRPCLGAWVSYGLGSLNDNLPTFVVLVAKPTNTEQVQAISARLWSSGYLSGRARGRVASAPAATRSSSSTTRPACPPRSAAARSTACKALNEMNYQRVGDPETHTRIAAIRAGLPHAVERARADRHRQASRPRPTRSTARRPRSRARSPTRPCWPGGWSSAGVRFVQVYHNNWDTHANVAGRLPSQCRDVDQACCGLDPGPQAARPARRDAGHLGRRVRPHDLLAGRPDRTTTTAATTIRAASPCGWPAAASRPGTIYGETDDFSLQHRQGPGAHPRLPRHRAAPAWASTTSGSRYRYQGLDQRLTGVEPARVVKELLA